MSYDASDPRSKLGTVSGVAAEPSRDPYASDTRTGGAAAAEYVKFHELPPRESSANTRTWYGRGQNMIVAYTEAAPGATFARASQLDEYVLLLLDPATSATVTAEGETREIPGFSLVIVPPGESTITVAGGRVVRMFSTRNEDLAALCSNNAAYKKPHPNIPPFKPWPAPPSGHRIRSYSLDVPPKEGRFGRIWRCTTLMVNVLPYEPLPRDVTKLSPHHHEDFEQCSLALDGAFTHHIRWPWTANQHDWRADDHEVCPAPSIAVIPPPAIHTSAAMDAAGNQLIDIFSPPRFDFSKMRGWVLNADEYPMP